MAPAACARGVEVFVKQISRFFLRPNVFFNQLQWSNLHWGIIVAFAVMATLETHVGRYSDYYLALSSLLNDWAGLSLAQAVWVITAGKLVATFAGAYLVSTLVWIVGSVLGRSGSKRVLFRRLAVVFTVLMLGQTLGHLSAVNGWYAFAALAAYAWGGLLGYFAVREQFSLSHLETIIVTALVALVLSTTIHFSSHALMLAADSREDRTAPALSHRPSKRLAPGTGSRF